MVTLFDEEKIMKAHDKTILEQGISQGVVEGIVKMCKRYNGTIRENKKIVPISYTNRILLMLLSSCSDDSSVSIQ